MAARRMDISALLCADADPNDDDDSPLISHPVILAPHLRGKHARPMPITPPSNHNYIPGPRDVLPSSPTTTKPSPTSSMSDAHHRPRTIDALLHHPPSTSSPRAPPRPSSSSSVNALLNPHHTYAPYSQKSPASSSSLPVNPYPHPPPRTGLDALVHAASEEHRRISAGSAASDTASPVADRSISHADNQLHPLHALERAERPSRPYSFSYNAPSFPVHHTLPRIDDSPRPHKRIRESRSPSPPLEHIHQHYSSLSSVRSAPSVLIPSPTASALSASLTGPGMPHLSSPANLPLSGPGITPPHYQPPLTIHRSPVLPTHLSPVVPTRMSPFVYTPMRSDQDVPRLARAVWDEEEVDDVRRREREREGDEEGYELHQRLHEPALDHREDYELRYRQELELRQRQEMDLRQRQELNLRQRHRDTSDLTLLRQREEILRQQELERWKGEELLRTQEVATRQVEEIRGRRLSLHQSPRDEVQRQKRDRSSHRQPREVNLHQPSRDASLHRSREPLLHPDDIDPRYREQLMRQRERELLRQQDLELMRRQEIERQGMEQLQGEDLRHQEETVRQMEDMRARQADQRRLEEMAAIRRREEEDVLSQRHAEIEHRRQELARIRREEEEIRHREEELEKRKEEALEHRRQEEEADRRREEEAIKRRRQEEETERQRQEEEIKRQRQEEIKRRRQEEEIERRRQEEETERRRQEEEIERRRQEEEIGRRRQEEEIGRRRQEEEIERQRQVEEIERRRQEEDAERRRQEEEVERRRQEEDAQRLRAAELRQHAEAERQRLEREQRRREEEQKRQEEERKRQEELQRIQRKMTLHRQREEALVKQKEEERQLKEEQERKRKQREQAERKEREELERKRLEEAEQQAQREAERKQREETENQRLELERKELEAEHQRHVEAERLRLTEESERKQREDLERQRVRVEEQRQLEELQWKQREEALRRQQEELAFQQQKELERRQQLEQMQSDGLPQDADSNLGPDADTELSTESKDYGHEPHLDSQSQPLQDVPILPASTSSSVQPARADSMEHNLPPMYRGKSKTDSPQFSLPSDVQSKMEEQEMHVPLSPVHVPQTVTQGSTFAPSPTDPYSSRESPAGPPSARQSPTHTPDPSSTDVDEELLSLVEDRPTSHTKASRFKPKRSPSPHGLSTPDEEVMPPPAAPAPTKKKVEPVKTGKKKVTTAPKPAPKPKPPPKPRAKPPPKTKGKETTPKDVLRNTLLAKHAAASRSRSASVMPVDVMEEPDAEEDSDREDDKLYCVCKTRYDEDRVMIACDRCDEWYHTQCVNMPDLEVDLVDQFICPVCIQGNPKLNLQTTYKRRCFFGIRHTDPSSPSACHKPSRGAFSKYCSDECGVKYMKMSITQWERSGGKCDRLWETVRNAEKREGVVVCADATVEIDGKSFTQKRKADREIARLNARLENVVREREMMKREMDMILWRERLVELASERAERVDECGWDQRLCFGDEEFLDFGAEVLESYEEKAKDEVTEDAMQIDGATTSHGEWWCTGKKKCERHAGWQKLRAAEVAFDKETKESILSNLTTREREIRKGIEDILYPQSQSSNTSQGPPKSPADAPLNGSSKPRINGEAAEKGKKKKP